MWVFASQRVARHAFGLDKVTVGHHLEGGEVLVMGGRSRPQKRQTIASALIVSAQNGHFLVGSTGGREEGVGEEKGGG